MQKIILKDIENNLKVIEELFKDCYDIVIRRIEVGDVYRVKMAIVYIDGLVNKDHISEYTIGALLSEEEVKNFSLQGFKSKLTDIIYKEVLYSSELSEEHHMDKIIDIILSGDTVLFIDGMEQAIIIGSKGWATRGISEPETETVVRGPREGFTEVLKINTTLIRRRIRDTNLKITMQKVGRRSKTDVAVIYMDDIVDKGVLQEVNERIRSIDIDAIQDSSMLENLIEDNYLSAFPQIENTERPDSVAAALCEGRIAIIVDNSPFALIVPATIGTLFQSSEDYYNRWTESQILRSLRLVAFFLCVLSPALYISIISYHPGILPTKLTYYLAASRINVPFPSVVETFLMEITIELIRESGTRISGPIGTTIGIVGGLIIGQAAVEAGIVSSILIIIVAVTTISSFAIPSYEFASGLRVWRFLLIIFAAFLGLYGVMLGLIVLITHLIKLNSFGVPFTSPYSGLGISQGELKDTLFKSPIQYLEERPTFTKPRNKVRMRRTWKDERD
ncbi:spore germination protein [Tissierella pigra]|uniref:spore germination protein n=1 Tax=Tissierella pigra TaxID=2607614 RepID=UPI001C11231C|nr:spore germination protein [Tissierella pigra]MBU5427950.1 spore germination protein [Tissierella pigra]